MTDIRLLIDRRFKLAESPLWDAEEQRLFWVEGYDGEIWSCRDDGSDVKTWQVGTEIGAMALRGKGGVVIALKYGFGLFDFDRGELETFAGPTGDDPAIRLNDGKVDPGGRFIVGSLDMETIGGDRSTWPGPPRGALYRLDTDLSLHPLADDIAVSNGPCWSADGQTFYFTDSMVPAIYAYDWDVAAGVPANRRVFYASPGKELPDGATVDARGHYWYAANGLHSGEGAICCVSPDGQLERRIPMPVAKVTSIAFGGPDLDILYVTSMSVHGGVRETPLDGSVFAIHGLGVRGVAARRFAG